MSGEEIKHHHEPHIMHRRRVKEIYGVCIISISTSRYRKMVSGESYRDESGDLVESMLSKDKYRVVKRTLIQAIYK